LNARQRLGVRQPWRFSTHIKQLMQKPTFDELRQLALDHRQCGVLTMAYEPRETVKPVSSNIADSFVANLGFKPLGKAWREINRTTASALAQHVLYRDLAYQSRLMEQKTAAFIAEKFLALFSPYTCRFLTNGSINEHNMLGWDPISDSTFDHGIVVFDEKNIGMVWVEDED